MPETKLYVDFHIIQTVPPSCVNRDDTGSPKNAVYGGVRRARVSSQAWKKATRDLFIERGERTKHIVEIVAEKLGGGAEAAALAEKIIKEAAISISEDKKTKKPVTGALFFISDRQAEALAQLALSGNFDKKAAQAALNNEPSIDIALFGRMVADDPKLNIDASCQVAHAISTHRVDTEFDYFTAIDDRSPDDNAGAGMIGTVEFNSSTLYRYATIAAHDLAEQIGDTAAAAAAVRTFAGAFVRSMPTGKQNTFANRTPPDHVLIMLRHDQPVNLVGAFEKPIRSDDGFVEKSIERLNAYSQKVYENYCDAPDIQWELAEGLHFLQLLEQLESEVAQRLEREKI
ncbi:MAG: type I-E CRISPR-associated protein Cas7/Cse4/CasC [Christensenellaceae bacterium]|jgi:CRISPR system Cascade subunit CasC|nr:type I-E CRISPR-associated protein Cas7/Cse4/CasC [Christensenellaceae bacterium]